MCQPRWRRLFVALLVLTTIGILVPDAQGQSKSKLKAPAGRKRVAIINPFLPPAERQRRGKLSLSAKLPKKKKGIRLQGIVQTGRDTVALVNGQAVRRGDRIDGKIVREITAEQVALEDSTGVLIILKMRRPK
jgi:hypothetical protein